MKSWIGILGIFCVLGLPLQAQAQTYSKTETTVYSDNLTVWVLGQVSKTTVDGTVVSETAYDTLARPTTIKSFGKLKQTLTYNADGTVATVKDGGNHVTTVTGWKRGIPQQITYPATTDQPATVSQLADVGDNGTIASVTDESGYTTHYTYDAMGRLASVTYPTGDVTSWKPTTQTFVASTAAKYGLPAGHWEQTVSTDAGVKKVYFDGLWRPVVEESYDSGDAGNTRSLVVKRYDEAGRLVFQSWPLRTLGNYATVTAGTTTTYDALDRVLAVSMPSADSVTGSFVTTTTYLNDADGPYTRVTDPNGHQTKTWYQMFDQPDYTRPVEISHPEATYTSIARNVFGKPLSLVRHNSANTVQETRSYTYNSVMELCRTVEPETGATLMGYDAAGNLAWSASGLAAGTACDAEGDTAAILARKATRSYDARNRVMALVFPDHLGDTSYHYTKDSLPASVATDNGGGHVVTTSYTYDRRRLLRQEAAQWDAVDWTIAYAYDDKGHLSSQTLPSGQTVAYAPNALGQPTQAGPYASSVRYYPNGGIASFVYGNNIVHTMTQNDRQLPERSLDSYGATATLDDSYDYDGVGNVAAISDGLSSHRGNRLMTYDGLDRLVRTESPMYGSPDAVYSYDVLDNLTHVQVGGTAARDQAYCYDTSWRLTNVATGSCSGSTVIGLGYDAQGNLNNKNGIAYTFDYGNRLRSVGSSPASAYLYDGQGRRVRDATSAAKDSLYNNSGQLVYDSDLRLGQQHDYIQLGGSLVAIRERDVASGTYTVKYQHTDALGSPVAVTDQTRVVLERTEYEPFGKVLNRPLRDGPGYTGHVEDAATGMDYMQQRYYDPGIGRFLSRDPVTANSSTGANFNAYWYANNNPYRFTDPDGRFGMDWLGGPCDLRPCTWGLRGVRSVGPIDNPNEHKASGTKDQKKQDSKVSYKPGVPEAKEEIGEALECIGDCSDEGLRVTSTDEAIPQHQPGTPHRRGVAADFTVRAGSESRVLSCSVLCGVKFALDEGKHPSARATGPHIHVQTVPGTSGGRGDLPVLLLPKIVPIW